MRNRLLSFYRSSTMPFSFFDLLSHLNGFRELYTMKSTALGLES